MSGGGGHHACMFVCHDKKWHNRYPIQCQVVEGIIHVCLYVMIKSGTIDIQHSAGWWRASFMYVCLSLIKSGTIDIQHSAGWWRASFMYVCLSLIKRGTIDLQHIAGWWRASCMHLRIMYVTDKKGIEIILHVKQINSYLIAPMYL